jgi:hypothetical protein
MTHPLFPILASSSLSLAAACASGSSGVESSPFSPFVVAADATSAPSAVDAVAGTQQDTGASPSYATTPPAAAGDDVAAPDAPDADDSSTGTLDLSVDDGSGQEDAGQDAAQDDAADVPWTAASAAIPSAGDLVISEIMYAPSGPLPDFQWFEVCNLTGAPLLLSGVTIDDGQGDLTTIPSAPTMVIDPYAFALLVRSRTGAAAAQLPSGSIVYEYGAGAAAGQGIQLATDATGALALWEGSTLLADVPYGTWALASPGQSIELAYLQYSGADQPGSWCSAFFSWGPVTDEGTPGQPSDCY